MAKDVPGGSREERSREGRWFDKKMERQRHQGAKETVPPPQPGTQGTHRTKWPSAERTAEPWLPGRT